MNQQSEKQARNKKKLRVGVIGYGFISGQGHVPAYLQRMENEKDIEIVAIADITEARRVLASQAVPSAEIYEDAESLIENEAENLDFVDICTPPYDHVRIAKMALKKGLHVLCEKPLTTTYKEAEDLLKLARSCKRVLFPCHNYKHAPIVKATREIIESGRIGEVKMVTLNTFRNTHAKGVSEWNTNWRRFKDFSGGGIAMDHGSHSLYLIFDWMKSFPVKVSASTTNMESDVYDTEDNFQAELVFPNGLAHINLTWTAGVRKNIYIIHGTRGALTIHEDDLEIATMKNVDGITNNNNISWEFEHKKISSHWMDASHVSWFNSLINEFKVAIDNDLFAAKEANEALWCIKVINKAYESAGQKRRKMALAL